MEQPSMNSRTSSKKLDELFDQTFPVLSNGFIRLIDYMGTDASIVQAARVSYGAGTKAVSEDRALIRYLLRNKHTSPFEMPVIRFHIRAPIFVFRQWHRHRTASLNEISGRYSVLPEEMETTRPKDWRLQAKDNKQGSADTLEPEIGATLTVREAMVQTFCRTVYQERLDAGVARELARKDLPVSNYSEMYWQIDAHNLLHFLALRMDPHAQQEIREYANVIGHEFVARWLPETWQAFRDYRLQSISLSNAEQTILRCMMDQPKEVRGLLVEHGLLNKGKPGRELVEFGAKLEHMGLGDRVIW